MGSKRCFAKAWLVVAALFVMASLGVGAQSDSLVIWSSEAQIPALLPMAEAFETEYGMPVEVREVNFGDIRSNFLISAPTGTGPDIIVGAHDWLGELSATGLLEPIDLTAAQQDAFTQVSLDAFTYNGRLYGVPYAIEAIALMYNKALVPSPPETFEELIAIARDLTDPGANQYGFLYPNVELYYTFPMLAANGGYIFRFTEDGFDASDVGVDNAGSIAGGELALRLVQEGLVPRTTDYQSMRGLFLDGRVGMILTGPWESVGARAAGIDYGIAPIPSIDGHPSRPFVGVQGFMINSFSPYKLLAVEFLERFVATTEGQVAIWQEDPRVPALSSAFEAVASDPDVAGFGASAAQGIPMPNIPEMAVVWSAMNDAMTFIVNEDLTPEEALAGGARQIRNAISGGH